MPHTSYEGSGDPVAARRGRIIRGTAMITCAVLILFRLGHYALWDDEAFTALAAKAVARSADTSLVIGHNVVIFRDGLIAHNLHDRSTPPLAAYLAALFVGENGTDALPARLPFALGGIGMIALILWWSRRLTLAAQIGIALGIVLNVSLLLYLRQCRYYAPALLLSTALVWLYVNWTGRPAWRWALAAVSVLLFWANYMNWVALHVCLAADYLLWHRRDRKLTRTDWLKLAVAIFVGCAVVGLIWNPLRTRYAQAEPNSLADRLKLFWWYWRDLNACEFGSLALLGLATGLGLRNPRGWLLRGVVAVLIFVGLTTMVSPQVVAFSQNADVRYIAPCIPLLVFVSVVALAEVARQRVAILLPLCLVAFGTNLPHGGPFLERGLRCTPADFVGELLHPPRDPYRITSEWIKANVAARQSIWVLPLHMTYPLMFHAPEPVYAWQISASNQDPQFSGLPLIHFQTHVAPDYIIVFGPKIAQLLAELPAWETKGIRYQHVVTLDCYWQDHFRPELFWRTFRAVEQFDRRSQAIYVLRRVSHDGT
jgi:hypothetical protein